MPRGHKGEPKTPGSGRKPKYSTVEEMQGKIDAYFESCKGRLLTDPDTGKPILDKFFHPVILDETPPTITGLALALGFTGRNGLLRYQGKKEFMDCITRAKSRIEEYYEGRLFDRDGANGARFALSCIFKWGEDLKKDAEGSGSVVKIVCDIPREAPTPGTDAATTEQPKKGAADGATPPEGKVSDDGPS